MRPVSYEVRELIIKHHEKGEKPEDIAKIIFRGVATVYRIIKLHKESGDVKCKKHGGNNHKITPKQEKQILELYKEKPDNTLNNTIEELGLSVTESGLSRFLAKLGLSYKKRHFTQTGKKEKMS
jgi:transposase